MLCARKYLYQEGWRLEVDAPEPDYLTMGSGVHEFQYTYDLTGSFDEALRSFVKRCKAPNTNLDTSLDTSSNSEQQYSVEWGAWLMQRYAETYPRDKEEFEILTDDEGKPYLEIGFAIDADEGIQENSRRHGYMLSMLGIKQIVVLINKMDLVDYDEKVYIKIKKEYDGFLKNLGLKADLYVPVSGIGGDNIVDRSEKLNWYSDKTVLDVFESFKSSKPSEIIYPAPGSCIIALSGQSCQNALRPVPAAGLAFVTAFIAVGLIVFSINLSPLLA